MGGFVIKQSSQTLHRGIEAVDSQEFPVQFFQLSVGLSSL